MEVLRRDRDELPLSSALADGLDVIAGLGIIAERVDDFLAG